MKEGSIQVPEAAAQRIRNLFQSAQHLEQLAQMSAAMLRDALGAPQEWQLVEDNGIMYLTSVTQAEKTENQPTCQ